MLKTSLTFLLIVFSLVSFSQKYSGYILELNGDTTRCFFKNPFRKDNSSGILFKIPKYHKHYNSIYPKNARELICNDKIAFRSIDLGGTEGHKWAELLLRSDSVKILKYNSKLYYEFSDKLVLYDELCSSLKTKFIDDLCSLDDLYSISCVEKYFDENTIDYKRYFNRKVFKANIIIGIGQSIGEYQFRYSNDIKTGFQAFDTYFTLGKDFSVPVRLKSLKFSAGINLHKLMMDKTIEANDGSQYYHDLHLDAIKIDIPVQINIPVFNSKIVGLDYSLGTGLSGFLTAEANHVTEYIYSGIVRKKSSNVLVDKTFVPFVETGATLKFHFLKKTFAFAFDIQKWKERDWRVDQPEIWLGEITYSTSFCVYL